MEYSYTDKNRNSIIEMLIKLQLLYLYIRSRIKYIFLNWI